MDPDANVQEQIALLRKASEHGWTGDEANRFVELAQAYREWRARGGFPASATNLSTLAALRDGLFQ